MFTPHLVVARLAYVKYVLVVRLRFRVRLQMYMVFTPHLVVVRLACVKYVWLCGYVSELDFRIGVNTAFCCRSFGLCEVCFSCVFMVPS